jgi:hypothetical protein
MTIERQTEIQRKLRTLLPGSVVDNLLDHAAQLTTADTLDVQYTQALVAVLNHVQELGRIDKYELEHYLEMYCPDIAKVIEHRKHMPDTIDGVGNEPAPATLLQAHRTLTESLATITVTVNIAVGGKHEGEASAIVHISEIYLHVLNERAFGQDVERLLPEAIKNYYAANE